MQVGDKICSADALPDYRVAAATITVVKGDVVHARWEPGFGTKPDGSRGRRTFSSAPIKTTTG